MKYDYDVAVVGAGSGGLTVALGLVKQKRVVLIEGGPIGGDCTNFGCVPSKALIDIAKHKPKIGFQKAMAEVQARRQVIQDEETVDKIESHGLKVIEGYASFIDEHTLEIQAPAQHLSPTLSCQEREQTTGKTKNNESHLPSQGRIERGVSGGENCTQKITAEKIILATGSSAKKIEIEGVDEADILTNHEIFEQTGDIKKLIVIGGGYIGCELAESIAALGVEVHLVQRNKYLIPQEEQESSELLQKIFEAKGIKMYTGSHVERAEGKKLIITDIHGENGQNIEYDKILVATGRSANTGKLNLENADIYADKKGILVDSYNRANKKHIFAIGDCVSGNPQFTHWANHEGRGVIRNMLVPSILKKTVRSLTLPVVLYTHLEIARAGKTEQELKKIYDREEFVTKTLYFGNNDRSKVTQDTHGFIKIHFKRLSGKILGATIFGKNAGEMIGQITIAMDHKISAYKLSSTIQAYPTKSDLIKRVCDLFVVGTIGNFQGEIKYLLKNNILQIVTGIIWLSIIILFFYYKITSGQSVEAIALNFYNSLSGSSMGIFIFIFAYTLRPIILFPATLMTFLSGALFGFTFGLIATLIGATFSAVIAYFIGQVFGKKIISSESSGLVGKIKNDINTSPFLSILSTRLLFFPYDLVNYVAGLLKIKLFPFVLATLVGIIPGSAIFVLAGSSLYGQEITSLSQAISSVDTTILLVASGLFLVSILVSKFLKKKYKF